MAVLKTENLTKVYKRGLKRTKFTALDNLSIEVKEGEIFGYLGPNGAGKTTTMKILLRLLRPTKGTASILGTNIHEAPKRLRLGYMPENPYFYRFLTGEEFLKFFTRLNRIPVEERKRRIDELLSLVGMEHARGVQIREYSKGMVQRIGLAQALMHDPKLVLLDEPLSGVDPIGRKEIRDLIYRLKCEQGRTIFFCSHILSDVQDICDRVAILHHGKLLRMGDLDDLLGRKDERLRLEVRLPETLDPADLGVPGDTHARIFKASLPNKDDTYRKIEEWRGKGAEILAIIPERKTLEDCFVETIREADPNVALET
jgi:ABC-2 type transport system ATP-binding protein